MNTFRHADNLIGRVGKASLESLPQGLFARPITLRKRFVYNRDWRLVFHFLVAERASLKQWDLQRLEILRRHRIEVGESLLSAPFGNEWSATVLFKRRDRSQAHGFHSRQSFQPLDDLAVEDSGFVLVVALLTQIQRDHERSPHLEAGVKRLRVLQTSDQQAGSDEQRETNRHLGDDQQVTQPRATQLLAKRG